jgi:hypothetical protein
VPEWLKAVSVVLVAGFLFVMIRMEALNPAPDTDRLLRHGITAVGSLGDKILPSGVSAPDKLDGRSQGSYYEVRIGR